MGWNSGDSEHGNEDEGQKRPNPPNPLAQYREHQNAKSILSSNRIPKRQLQNRKLSLLVTYHKPKLIPKPIKGKVQ